MIKKLLIAAVVVFIAYAAQNAYKGSLIANKSDEVVGYVDESGAVHNMCNDNNHPLLTDEDNDVREYKFPTLRELDPPMECKNENGLRICFDKAGVLPCNVFDVSCQQYHDEIQKREITKIIDARGNIADNDLSFSNPTIIVGAIDGYGISAYVVNSKGKVIGETFGDGMVYHYLGWEKPERVYYKYNDAIGQLNDEGIAFDKDGNIIGVVAHNVFCDNLEKKPRCDISNKWCREYCEKNCPKKQAQYKKERPIASALHKLVKKLKSYTITRKQMPE
jgi:hypothetical protein